MKCNVGKTDKRVRAVVGVVIIVIGVYFKSWWGAIGILPLLTAITGFCPGYVPFKISTVGKKKKK